MINLQKLATEQRNAKTNKIDSATTLELVQIMNDEDHKVADAVHKILPQVAAAVDMIASHLRRGGRLFYVGSGTSGRLGILDAAECPPTFSTSPELVQGILAGGESAVFRAKEGAEDDAEQGAKDLAARSATNGGGAGHIHRLDLGQRSHALCGRRPYLCPAKNRRRYHRHLLQRRFCRQQTGRL